MQPIHDLISQMTLEEKAALCTGAGPWSTTPLPRLDIPALFVSDGPHGIRFTMDSESLASKSYPATCFPTASCMASTWNPELLSAVGKAIAIEAIALGIGVVLGPAVNMKRSPLCGRNFEYFSEDPFLAGILATAWIEGVQNQGVGTSIKHFAANNQEFQRFSINAVVDERSLHEIYLPAFEMAVRKAQPWTVMCAYNQLNGTYCANHEQLLSDILRDQWGFEGFVMSDWGAVHDRVASIKAGLELEMPGPKDRRVNEVILAVKDGELNEAVLDEAIRRLLTVILKAAETSNDTAFDVNAHHELARDAAAEGFVLLTNNNILPFKTPQNLALIGHAARKAHFQGGGSSHINPTRVDHPYDALLKHGDEIQYAQGYTENDIFDQSLIDQAVATARAAEVALLFIALPESKESEGYDRPDLDLTQQQIALIKAVCAVQKNSIVVLNTGSPVAMTDWIDGPAAILQGWMMGQAGADALTDILYGKINPSGKLAETFPTKITDTPAYTNWPGENGEVRYGEGLFIGYRYYDFRKLSVQFPFGYGLSYTSFEYRNAQLSSDHIKDSDTLVVSVDVTNTGDMTGKEIVQVYVHDQKCTLIRPPQELKGFAKVHLEPGETKTVTISLDFRSFAFYHPAHKLWVCEDGDFDILIGASSRDIHAQLSVHVQSTQELPCVLNESSTLKEWQEDSRGMKVLEPLFKKMIESMGVFMSGEESSEGGIGMDMMGFMKDMPLESILAFQEDQHPKPPAEIVKELLAQIK
ncbi:MAG: glycoside hydrolase family 3 C-terminal domain-containing protein [Anaerolineaceae bacterium]|nr:glycoside hydrolase family 3 C-terminal domain-containing protein [Anaerolineaceae bacterium]